ncbi:hypothetical protein [Paraburkholderia tropica]|uniref:hypothetical protein n=1 Tax=Paraburkholderia tropica TaxID=92647 RepID=UPI002AAF7F67|nr:hypothetical protein [Paraburkholderia tropica]
MTVRDDQTRECVVCHAHKALSEFYADRGRRDGLRRQCKLCEHEGRSERKRAQTVAKNAAAEAERAERIANFRKACPDAKHLPRALTR